MKNNINTILVCFFVLQCLIGIVVFFQSRGAGEKGRLLVEKHMEGVIVKQNNWGRGHYYFKVRNHLDSLYEFDLAIAWFLRENHIKVGDSLGKVENSSAIRFYKKQNNRYDSCCEYQILTE